MLLVASAGVWYHLVLVANKTTNNLTVYINGVVATSYTPAAHPTSFTNFYMMGNASGNYIDGRLDEVIYLSRALTAAEVTDVYNLGMAPGNFNGNNLELHLPMNEINAGTTPDASGLGRHAQLFNGPTLIPRP